MHFDNTDNTNFIFLKVKIQEIKYDSAWNMVIQTIKLWWCITYEDTDNENLIFHQV